MYQFLKAPTSVHILHDSFTRSHELFHYQLFFLLWIYDTSLLANSNCLHLSTCWPHILFSHSLFCSIPSHTRLLTLLACHQILCLFHIPQESKTVQSHSRCLMQTFYLILESLLEYQNDGYTIRKSSVIILWITTSPAQLFIFSLYVFLFGDYYFPL